MQIKLNQVSCDTDDVRRNSQGLQQAGLEDAMNTIENFGEEAVNLHSRLKQLADSGHVVASETIEFNLKVLKSLSSVVKLIWTEFKRIKAQTV